MHKSREGKRTEGYWWSEHEPTLPMPVVQEPWEGQIDFLERFEKVEALTQVKRVGFRGSSRCRICSCLNGSEDIHLDNWVWPSGLSHYVREHNVIPSQEFISFINSRSLNLNGTV